MKLKFIVMALICIMLSSCAKEQIKDNIVDTSGTGNEQSTEEACVKLDSNGINPFRAIDYNVLPPLQSSGESIVTLSPDKSVLFIQSRTNKQGDNVIMGPLDIRVDLIKIDLARSLRQVIAKDINFINIVKWNKDGSCAGFQGGNKLTLYDLKRDKLLLKKELENEVLTYFGWSPEGKILYTEHPNLANGSKLNIVDEKIQAAYENDDTFYYKGVLDDNYFYGTLKNMEYYYHKDTQTIEEYATVISDSRGNIVKQLPGGRFRDAYGLSMLQTDKNGVGLYLYEDINNTSDVKEITYEITHDAKFICNGGIAYIVKKRASEKNAFNLHILDAGGNEKAVYEVSGNSFLLTPDGKTGYVNGLKYEVVHFDNNVIEALNSPESQNIEREEIITAIRGGLDIWYKFSLTGEEDYETAKKYLIDTSSPEQWAYFDAVTEMKYRKNSGFQVTTPYEIDIILRNMKIYNDRAGVRRATAAAIINGESSSGGGFGEAYTLELIKNHEKWYITGFSTYPYTKQAEDAKKKVEKYVKDARAGRLFEGQLKGKDIKIGQIQFWQMSSPHLADSINYANYCKVYLKVMENGQEVIYKMVLENKNQKEWKPKSLSKGRLSGL